jgi:flagellar protein FliO/FliZ
LGGEKLKASLCISKNRLKFISPFCLAVMVGIIFLFMFNSPLSAQDAAVAADSVLREDPRASEQNTLLGEAPPPGTVSVQGPASVFVVIRMILVLVLVAAAIYGVVWFFKKANRRTDPKDPNLRVLSTVHLGLNRYVHIVFVGSKAYLVGAADGGVSLITEIEDKDLINSMLLAESQKSSASGSGGFQDFKAILRRFGIQSEGKVPTPDTIKRRRERLKGL